MASRQKAQKISGYPEKVQVVSKEIIPVVALAELEGRIEELIRQQKITNLHLAHVNGFDLTREDIEE